MKTLRVKLYSEPEEATPTALAGADTVIRLESCGHVIAWTGNKSFSFKELATQGEEGRKRMEEIEAAWTKQGCKVCEHDRYEMDPDYCLPYIENIGVIFLEAGDHHVFEGSYQFFGCGHGQVLEFDSPGIHASDFGHEMDTLWTIWNHACLRCQSKHWDAKTSVIGCVNCKDADCEPVDRFTCGHKQCCDFECCIWCECEEIK